MTDELELKIIQAFIYLVKQQDKSIFPDHFKSLSQLDENLEKLESKEDIDVANIIMDWCENYSNIKQALQEALQEAGKDIESKYRDIVKNEEQIPSNINLQNEEGIINNKVLVRRVIQTHLQQQAKTADSENNE